MKQDEIDEYYKIREKKNAEFVQCYVYFVLALILVAVIFTIYDWICR